MKIINADCKEALQQLVIDGVQVDSIVTDPPYELGFMGKSWDKTGIAYNKELWELCLKVLKPGAHLLAFGGARTYHRMASAIEEAGFEIRDQIMWVFGSGFPKSLNISKQIDKDAGAEREVVSINENSRPNSQKKGCKGFDKFISKETTESAGVQFNTIPATELAKKWDGWGTGLKPAHEPIVLARKPISEKTITKNVVKHGTGAINIDECRVNLNDEPPIKRKPNLKQTRNCYGEFKHSKEYTTPQGGRFPANLIHDGSEEVEEEFAKQSKAVGMHRANSISKNYNEVDMSKYADNAYKLGIKKRIPFSYGESSDNITASRFYYSAKVSAKERMGSKHPTIKPISLIRYLCRLITPKNGIVLDPFAGTGTTGLAAKLEGFDFILIEKEKEYINDIENKLNAA